MKIFKKLRAIFNFKGQRAEMELKSAEIRGNRVYLHPAEDPNHTFCIFGKPIDILIDPAAELTEDDFIVIENEKLSKLQQQMEIDPTSPIEKLLQHKTTPSPNQPTKPKEAPKPTTDNKTDTKGNFSTKKTNTPNQVSNAKPNVSYGCYMPKMRTISMRLYQEEYDFVMAAMEAKGYKKNEFLLACVAAAKKKSMEQAYRQYYEAHRERRKADREAAKRALEEANQENQVSA